MKRPPSSLEPGVELSIAPLGAIGGVTGSRTLVSTPASRVLIDCGMFQGSRSSESFNRRPLGFKPAELDAVVLTHAHLDHSGLLPLLVTPKRSRERLRAGVHTSAPTAALLEVMLRDSAHIQEADARQDNRRARRRGGREVTPLYTAEHVEQLLGHVSPHDFDRLVPLTDDIQVRFRHAGHILGAASLELRVHTPSGLRRVVFSGDLGRRGTPLICDPVVPQFDDGPPDLVFSESTYGDREHRGGEDTQAELLEILTRSKAARGTVVIPVFAVGRAQELLFSLRQAFQSHPELARPVALDSPMAISVTKLYESFGSCFSESCRGAGAGDFEPRELELTRTPEQSIALNSRRDLIILSASGMCTAGRIRHHLKHRLWQAENEVVIVGYQAHGSLGRRLVEGARRVRLMGQDIAVRARINTLGGFSAHAGKSELLEWVEAVKGPKTTIVLNHGEDAARAALARALRTRRQGDALVPAPDQRLEWRERARPELVG